MLLWLKNKFVDKKDPVESCQVYKDVGCVHVDGMLCQMDTCSTLKRYNTMRQCIRDRVGEVTMSLTGDPSCYQGK